MTEEGANVTNATGKAKKSSSSQSNELAKSTASATTTAGGTTVLQSLASSADSAAVNDNTPKVHGSSLTLSEAAAGVLSGGATKDEGARVTRTDYGDTEGGSSTRELGKNDAPDTAAIAATSVASSDAFKLPLALDLGPGPSIIKPTESLDSASSMESGRSERKLGKKLSFRDDPVESPRLTAEHLHQVGTRDAAVDSAPSEMSSPKKLAKKLSFQDEDNDSQKQEGSVLSGAGGDNASGKSPKKLTKKLSFDDEERVSDQSRESSMMMGSPKKLAKKLSFQDDDSESQRTPRSVDYTNGIPQLHTHVEENAGAEGGGTDLNSAGRPVVRPPSQPTSRQNSRPSSRQNSRPSSRPNSRPSSRQNSRPSSRDMKIFGNNRVAPMGPDEEGGSYSAGQTAGAMYDVMGTPPAKGADAGGSVGGGILAMLSGSGSSRPSSGTSSRSVRPAESVGITETPQRSMQLLLRPRSGSIAGSGSNSSRRPPAGANGSRTGTPVLSLLLPGGGPGSRSGSRAGSRPGTGLGGGSGGGGHNSRPGTGLGGTGGGHGSRPGTGLGGGGTGGGNGSRPGTGLGAHGGSRTGTPVQRGLGTGSRSNQNSATSLDLRRLARTPSREARLPEDITLSRGPTPIEDLTPDRLRQLQKLQLNTAANANATAAASIASHSNSDQSPNASNINTGRSKRSGDADSSSNHGGSTSRSNQPDTSRQAGDVLPSSTSTDSAAAMPNIANPGSAALSESEALDELPSKPMLYQCVPLVPGKQGTRPSDFEWQAMGVYDDEDLDEVT